MQELEEIKARESRASEEIARLTSGHPGTNWRWSIPANPERDSDLILAESIADVPKLVITLARILSETEQQPVAHERIHQIIAEALA